MVFIFPLLGIVFSVLTLLLRRTTGSEIIFDGIFYAFDYTLLFALCFVAFLFVCSVFVDLEKPNKGFSRFYNAVIIFTLRVALSACNVKVKVEGADKIPKGRFVMVQNHLAMFDPIVSLVFLGKHEIGFITKPENFRLPIINKFMHRICCIAIDRENARNAVKSINAAAENVKNNVCSMAIYPEGTRARDGEMLPLHAGSFKIATKRGAPLVITTVDNTNLVHKNTPFRRTNITLRICEVIPPEEVASSTTAELCERTYKVMCRSLGKNPD